MFHFWLSAWCFLVTPICILILISDLLQGFPRVAGVRPIILWSHWPEAHLPLPLVSESYSTDPEASLRLDRLELAWLLIPWPAAFISTSEAPGTRTHVCEQLQMGMRRDLAVWILINGELWRLAPLDWEGSKNSLGCWPWKDFGEKSNSLGLDAFWISVFLKTLLCPPWFPGNHREQATQMLLQQGKWSELNFFKLGRLSSVVVNHMCALEGLVVRRGIARIFSMVDNPANSLVASPLLLE